MTAIPNIGCGFEDPPMMLALAQISFTHSPRIIQGITSVKASLEDLQLPVAQTKSRTNVSFSTPGAAPQVSQSEFWWFSSLDRRRAVAVAQNSVVLYDANYQSFQEFSKLLAEVVEIIVSEAGEGCFLRTVALRYLNGFESGGVPSPYLSDGLKGISTAQLNTNHFHHNYNFWCSTADDGKLVVNVKTVHGDQLIPRDIISAAIDLNSRFLMPHEVDAVQLDIHETAQKKTMERVAVTEIERLVGVMRKNAKTAFLSATTECAHKKWGIINP